MPRIQPVQRDTANEQAAGILDAVQSKMGMVPNLISTMATSPAVANAYLAFSEAMGSGALSGRLREQLALATGQSNGCDYCVAAHTLLGSKAGLSATEVENARRGHSDNARENAALTFAVKVVQERGNVTDQDVASLREAGFADGEISEIVGNVALNLFTNYFNHVAATDIDFPVAPELAVV